MYRETDEFKVHNCAAERIFSEEDLEKCKSGDEDLMKIYNLINEIFPEENSKFIGC
jgi:hypothetical protein